MPEIKKLPPLHKKLILAARRAQKKAYAPYSKFKVGAAVLTRSGKICSACNVENASYGLTLCAERSAVVKAVSEGAKEILAVAVSAGSREIISPCGACRQVLSEFAGDIPVLMVSSSGKIFLETLSSLLPFAFSKKHL